MCAATFSYDFSPTSVDYGMRGEIERQAYRVSPFSIEELKANIKYDTRVKLISQKDSLNKVKKQLHC